MNPDLSSTTAVLLAQGVAHARIGAPLASINLAEWLFTLSDQEYQACSTAHIAAASGRTSSGRRLSLNVERVGGSLLVQHYVEEIAERGLCRVQSISDSFTGETRTTLAITWQIEVKPLSENIWEFSNRVFVFSTSEFLDHLRKAGLSDLSPVKQSMTEGLERHNNEETPFFAGDIERKANAGIWLPAIVRSFSKGAGALVGPVC
jgi:hypothetical protein